MFFVEWLKGFALMFLVLFLALFGFVLFIAAATAFIAWDLTIVQGWPFFEIARFMMAISFGLALLGPHGD